MEYSRPDVAVTEGDCVSGQPCLKESNEPNGSPHRQVKENSEVQDELPPSDGIPPTVHCVSTRSTSLRARLGVGNCSGENGASPGLLSELTGSDRRCTVASQEYVDNGVCGNIRRISKDQLNLLKEQRNDSGGERQRLEVKVRELLMKLDREENNVKEHSERLRQEINQREKVILAQVTALREQLTNLQTSMSKPVKPDELLTKFSTSGSASREGTQSPYLAPASMPDGLPDPQHQQPEMRIRFKPEWSIFVGVFLEETFTLQPRSVGMEFNARQNELEFGIAHEVAFTKQGHLAVTYITSSAKVLLLKDQYTLLADSSARGVTLREPLGICLHRKEDVLVVADREAGHVTFLDQRCLDHRRDVRLQGLRRPCGVAVMTSGDLVVTQDDRAKMIGIFTPDGQHRASWAAYGPDRRRFRLLTRVFVDGQDLIWVRTSNEAIVAFDARGRLIHQVATPVAVYGLAELGGNLVAAISYGSFKPGGLAYPGEVISCDVTRNSYRTILNWSDGDLSNLGRILSVAVHGKTLAVLGHLGFKLYDVKPLSQS